MSVRLGMYPPVFVSFAIYRVLIAYINARAKDLAIIHIYITQVYTRYVYVWWNEWGEICSVYARKDAHSIRKEEKKLARI